MSLHSLHIAEFTLMSIFSSHLHPSRNVEIRGSLHDSCQLAMLGTGTNRHKLSEVSDLLKERV